MSMSQKPVCRKRSQLMVEDTGGDTVLLGVAEEETTVEDEVGAAEEVVEVDVGLDP
jgi:hypothetical protein